MELDPSHLPGDDHRPFAGAPTKESSGHHQRQALHKSPKCYEPPDQRHEPNDDPTSLHYYRGLYDYLLSTSFASSSRVGSVEVLPAHSLPADSPFSPNGPDTDLGIIRLTSILAFSSSVLGDDGTPILEPRGNGGVQMYGDAAGLLLAMHHFNNGVGAVIPEIEGINRTCPIRFLADFYDSESSQVTALDVFSHQILDHPDRPPAALFGAWRSAVSVPLGILSGVYEIPQVSPLSTSTELDDVTQYTHFTRLIPSDAGTARATVDYFKQRSPDMRHLGVLYVNDAYGSAFHQALKESAQAIQPESDRISVKGSPFSYNNAILNPDEINLAVSTLAKTGYHVFFGVFYDEHYELVMRSAMQFGIAGPGYVWIVSDGLSESYLHGRSYPAGSDLAIASQGIGILKAEGGRETRGGDTGYDRFVEAWYRQTDDMVEYYNCVGHPADNTADDPSIYYQAEPGFFERRVLAPTAGAQFVYDSVVAMGLAACSLLEEEGRRKAGTYFTGTELFGAFVEQSFEGASGNVLIDPETTSRDPKSAFFVLYNADGTTSKDGATTTFAVETVAHTSRSQEEENGAIAWENMEGKEFVYSDGTTTFPDPLPPVEHNYNYLSPGVRGAGLTLACLIFATAIFFAIWTYRKRNTRVIRASQPMFLQMIAFGTIIMAGTIVTLSIDDRVATQAGCDAACILDPWLLTYGFIIAFSSLFSKTWRVNKIFHHPSCRRVKVTMKDVILPFVVLFTLNTIVLAIWTALSPLHWVRIERGAVDPYGRSTGSYGTCYAETKEWVPYVSLILVINFIPVILANIQAYQARKITTEYAESKYIAIIMASIMQACFIGLPLVALVSDEPVALFIVRSGLIFVICMSCLLLIFCPKMYYWKKWKEDKIKKEWVKAEREQQRKRVMEYATAALERDDAAAVHASVPAFGKDETGRAVQLDISASALKNALEDDENKVEEEERTAPISSGATHCTNEGADKDPELGIKAVDAEEKNTTEAIDEMSANEKFRMRRQLSEMESFGDHGIRVTFHPKADSDEMRLLKAENDHLKAEKLDMYHEIHELRLLLRNSGNGEETESLSALSQHSVRKQNPRYASKGEDSQDDDASVPQRGMERTASDTLPQRGMERTASDNTLDKTLKRISISKERLSWIKKVKRLSWVPEKA